MRDDNPEVLEARRRGLRILPRSAGLAAVMAGQRVVAVAGTHGKTTTTSLLVSALGAAGADPSYTSAASSPRPASNAHDGTGDDFVVEADESDGAFLVYRPLAAIVTNMRPTTSTCGGTRPPTGRPSTSSSTPSTARAS